MSENRKIWFPAKTYGWGWGPPVYVFAMVTALIFICWKKGEPPKWRGGAK